MLWHSWYGKYSNSLCVVVIAIVFILGVIADAAGVVVVVVVVEFVNRAVAGSVAIVVCSVVVNVKFADADDVLVLVDVGVVAVVVVAIGFADDEVVVNVD